MDSNPAVIPGPTRPKKKILAADPASLSDWYALCALESDGHRHIVRWLGRDRRKPYEEMAKLVVRLLEDFRADILVTDAGGLGGPVAEQIAGLLDPDARRRYIRMTWTSGAEPTHKTVTRWSVPKLTLVEGLLNELEKGQLVIPTAVPLKDEFITELEAFRRKPRPSGNPAYEAGGSAHDDMISAVAMAVYVGKTVAGRMRPSEIDVGTVNSALEKDAGSYRWTFPLSPGQEDR